MEKEGEGAILFVATIFAVGLVALVGSLDYSPSPTGFLAGPASNWDALAGQSCDSKPCEQGLLCKEHFGNKVCKQALDLGDHCNTADKETACAGYNVGCYGSYCREKITAQLGEKCGAISATVWGECEQGICHGGDTFWAKRPIYQRPGTCVLPNNFEGDDAVTTSLVVE